jgi:hypothetical protein
MKGKIQRIAAIVRSFNNAEIGSHVGRLLDMGIGRVVVVTNQSLDQGMTPALLRNVKDPRLVLHEMARGYSWSNGLNVGLRSIQMANWELRSRGRPPFDFLLPLSVEAKLTRQHLQTMVDELTDSRLYAMVGTSFAGEKDGKPVDLGISYTLPRNTAALIHLDAFQCGIGGFDPQCDGEGGMEDYDLLLALLSVTGRKVGLQTRMLDLRVPLSVWKHYDQREKEKWEEGAIEKISSRWRSSYTPGSMEWRRVEYAAKDLIRQRMIS